MGNTLAEKLDEELAKLKSTVQKPNVLISGITGVGKSTLVNTIFGEEVAKSGMGFPVTSMLDRYETESVPVVLYDTVGYEVDFDLNTNKREEIFSTLTENETTDASKQIHFAWYLIDASSARVQPVDIEMCKRIKDSKYPLAVVLTKCDIASKETVETLKATVLREIANVPVFCVTKENIPNLGHIDLDQLCEWSYENLDDALQLAFSKAQTVNLELKKKKATAIVATFSAVNAGIGAIPIPFSDAPFLLASQGLMIAKVIYLFEVPQMESLRGLLVGSFTGSIGAGIAGQLSKVVPGLGSVINAVVASSITAIIGTATIIACHKYYSQVLVKGTSAIDSILNDIGSDFSSIIEMASKEAKKQGKLK